MCFRSSQTITFSKVVSQAALIQTSESYHDLDHIKCAASYHCLHTRSAQPGPVTSPQPRASPELQMDSSDPAGTGQVQRKPKQIMSASDQK